MNNRPKRSVRLLHCLMPTITPFINRTAAAVTVLAPIIVPGCCLIARVAA